MSRLQLIFVAEPKLVIFSASKPGCVNQSKLRLWWMPAIVKPSRIKNSRNLVWHCRKLVRRNPNSVGQLPHQLYRKFHPYYGEESRGWWMVGNHSVSDSNAGLLTDSDCNSDFWLVATTWATPTLNPTPNRCQVFRVVVMWLRLSSPTAGS